MDIQKLSNEAKGLQQIQAQQLQKLHDYLQTIQQVYRMELDEGELQIWLTTLINHPMDQITEAMDNLMLHPPKYEIEGQVQVWRGMPKLPDVIQKMTELKEYRASLLRANPPKYPECKDCDSTGWIQQMQESRTRKGYMISVSVRCACRKNFVLTP